MDPSASGLKWHEIDSKPGKGVELVNAKLSEALQKKTKFTQDEWNQFGINDLSAATFIEVGGTSATKYFRPAATYHVVDVNELKLETKHIRTAFVIFAFIDVFMSIISLFRSEHCKARSLRIFDFLF